MLEAIRHHLKRIEASGNALDALLVGIPGDGLAPLAAARALVELDALACRLDDLHDALCGAIEADAVPAEA